MELCAGGLHFEEILTNICWEDESKRPMVHCEPVHAPSIRHKFHLISEDIAATAKSVPPNFTLIANATLSALARIALTFYPRFVLSPIQPNLFSICPITATNSISLFPF
jgi:hypothetical protein